MATLYDLLGVGPGASVEELRRAYRDRVRELHPDVNPAAGDDAIRELNAAWQVLGHPESRREYDRRIIRTVPEPVVRHTEPIEIPEEIHHPLAWMFRPSALIVAVLLTITVVTAYAGSRVTESGPSSPSSTTASSSGDASQVGWLINQCMVTEPGREVVVPCSDPDSKQVMAVLPATVQCPAQTIPYRLTGRDQEVCFAAHR